MIATSFWTYITGSISVSPIGRTQPEKRYVLETVLQHLPNVTGSEGDMQVSIVQEPGYSSSCSHDELGQRTDKGTTWYGERTHRGMFYVQSAYTLVLHASLRDRTFEQTKREFMRWLCRLAKRVIVNDVLVRLGDNHRRLLIDGGGPYRDMFEEPSWVSEAPTEPNWCEYLLWQGDPDTGYPKVLAYKYFNDP